MRFVVWVSVWESFLRERIREYGKDVRSLKLVKYAMLNTLLI